MAGYSGGAAAGTCDVGIIGLAVMGSNLALNIADKGFQVAVYNRTTSKMQDFLKANPGYKNLIGCETLKDFAAALKKPRRALILVQAGKPTDSTIEQLSEVFEKDDVIVDTGNAHFRDQGRRAEELEAKGLRFLGMGISGGEEGARKGPAFFPGGTLSVWEDIKDVIEAASAKAIDGRPCAVMNGKGGAGSCVKMYHNAGEYAILQIWGEVCAVLTAWGVPPEKRVSVLESWKTKTGGKHPNLLSSYMLDITVEVMRMKDTTGAGGADDGQLLVTRTMDKIGSKGTGLWSVQEALGVGCPAPSLAEAVLARQMSMQRDERLANGKKIKLTPSPATTASDDDIEDLFWAATLSIIASYAQMFQCLRVLDKEFSFGLNLPATIATFRAGCILQGYLLQPMTEAFEADPNLSSLLVAFAPEIQENFPRFKRMIGKICSQSDVGIPVMLTSLNYIQMMLADNIMSAQVTALQRDVFGRHGFKRLDKEGDFNAQWPELQ
jgi:6-phosphogluconate dehydrogenase